MDGKIGDFVRVHSVILFPKNRAFSLPEDTKGVPLEMWTKGFLQQDAKVGDSVRVITVTGRVVEGRLLEINPVYRHSYGEYIPEIIKIGIQAKEILYGSDIDD